MKKTLLLCSMLILAGCSPSPPQPPAAGPAASATIVDETPGEAQSTETAAATATEAGPAAASPTEEKEAQEPMPAPQEATLDHAKLLDQLLFSVSNAKEGQTLLAQMAKSGDTRFVAGLIDTLRYQPYLGSARGAGDLTGEIGEALNTLTGQQLPADWFAWVEWAGQHPEIESFSDYPGWKGNLYTTLIDPQFSRFVYAGMKVDSGSRVEEIVWGGVRVDGIPALDNPKMIEPEEADYLIPEERVFGVSLNGDTRAYPARFLDWHEMFNDIVGGEPVSLAY